MKSGLFNLLKDVNPNCHYSETNSDNETRIAVILISISQSLIQSDTVVLTIFMSFLLNGLKMTELGRIKLQQ
jgi:hypothetical protein